VVAFHRALVNFQWSIDNRTDVLMRLHDLRFPNFAIEEQKVTHRQDKRLDGINFLDDEQGAPLSSGDGLAFLRVSPLPLAV
jgi:hypothetical protein